MSSSNISEHEEYLIPRLTNAVYSSFALLAGMQLDLFTPLKDGPMSTEQVAGAIGVGSVKLNPLLIRQSQSGPDHRRRSTITQPCRKTSWNNSFVVSTQVLSHRDVIWLKNLISLHTVRY